MKTVKVIEENSEEGLESLAGKRVTFFCANYIYTGVLSAFDNSQVKLTEASIVYETGPYNTPTWKDAQALPHPVYIRLNAVEMYGVIKE